MRKEEDKGRGKGDREEDAEGKKGRRRRVVREEGCTLLEIWRRDEDARER